MAKAILLTGVPGSGKTTALKQVISQLNIKVGGFYTEEIRDLGKRVGFKIVPLNGQERILAHVQIKGPPRIGKYGVDVEVVDEVAVQSLLRAQAEAELILLDEIGPMEILSKTFCRVVMDLLEAEKHIIGSIVQRSVPFADAVKAHPEVEILELRSDNRHEIVDRVLGFLEKSMFKS